MPCEIVHATRIAPGYYGKKPNLFKIIANELNERIAMKPCRTPALWLHTIIYPYDAIGKFHIFSHSQQPIIVWIDTIRVLNHRLLLERVVANPTDVVGRHTCIPLSIPNSVLFISDPSAFKAGWFGFFAIDGNRQKHECVQICAGEFCPGGWEISPLESQSKKTKFVI